MNTNFLPTLLGALVISGSGSALFAQAAAPASDARESLLSTPLELDAGEVSGPVSSATVEPSAESPIAAVSDSASERVTEPSPASAELVGPPLPPSASDSTPTEVAASRWAARPLPGSARASSGDKEIPISGDGVKDALQVGGGLAVVLALLWVLRSLVRRSGGKSGALASSGGRSPAGVASVLARYPIARGQQVLLLGIGQRIIVVHQAAGTMQTLSEITDAEEVLALRAQINGIDRANAERGFAAKLTQSLETKPEGPALAPVAGMPGLVSETVDLTRKRRGRLSGGGR